MLTIIIIYYINATSITNSTILRENFFHNFFRKYKSKQKYYSSFNSFTYI